MAKVSCATWGTPNRPIANVQLGRNSYPVDVQGHNDNTYFEGEAPRVFLRVSHFHSPGKNYAAQLFGGAQTKTSRRAIKFLACSGGLEVTGDPSSERLAIWNFKFRRWRAAVKLSRAGVLFFEASVPTSYSFEVAD